MSSLWVHLRVVSVNGLRVLALLSCLSEGACRSTPANSALSAQVREALETGRYADADALGTDWYSLVESREGSESLALARTLDWLVEARLKNGKAGVTGTLALAERAVRLKERHLGSSHPEMAFSLQNLGTAHFLRGEFADALPFHERALGIRSALKPDDPAVADSLDQIALSLTSLERFPEAQQTLARSQRIREQNAAETPLALARTLQVVGLLYRFWGDYAAAMPPLDRALDTQQRLAPDHPDTILTLQTRGDVLFLRGDIAAAQRVWLAADSIAVHSLRREHPVMAELLRRRGLAASSLGNLGEARQLREHALKVGEESLAPCDPTLVGLLNVVALSLQDGGEYSLANKLFQRALTRIEQCVRGGSSETATDIHATTVYNSALLAQDIGDLGEA